MSPRAPRPAALALGQAVKTLPPGRHGIPREQVAANQRRRLIEAIGNASRCREGRRSSCAAALQPVGGFLVSAGQAGGNPSNLFLAGAVTKGKRLNLW